MRIDAHQHFWRYDARQFSWITDEMAMLRTDFLPQHLRPELSNAGIEATVAVQTVQSEEETRFLLGLAEEHREIAGVVGWVDLCAADIGKRLEYFSRFKKLRGFRHIAQSEPDDGFLIRDDFLRGIASLHERHFTYDILIYPRQLPAAAELVRRFPHQPFILDHLAKPNVKAHEMEPWAAWMRTLGVRENVFCKLSGLVTEADWHSWSAADFKPYLDLVFEVFGESRLVFGSDWPVCLTAASYLEVKNLIESYAGSAFESIFGRNASSFYGIGA